MEGSVKTVGIWLIFKGHRLGHLNSPRRSFALTITTTTAIQRQGPLAHALGLEAGTLLYVSSGTAVRVPYRWLLTDVGSANALPR